MDVAGANLRLGRSVVIDAPFGAYFAMPDYLTGAAEEIGMSIERTADRNERREQIRGLLTGLCEQKRDDKVDLVQRAAVAHAGSDCAEVPSHCIKDTVDGHGDIAGNMIAGSLEQDDVEADPQGRQGAAHQGPLIGL